MRFITEFELLLPAVGARVNAYKEQSSNDIGKEIGNAFDWGRKAENKHMRWTLEIEAFPMDKWVEFRKRFMEALPEFDSVSRTRLLNALGDLDHSDELIVAARETQQNKQSGDAITNLSDQMEYRGPSSHCKACEDEKNGVKHIMAQKHTCRK